MPAFTEKKPTLDNYWRSIILFGRNVASYKFALAKSLLDLMDEGKTAVSYEELARPFARHITEHLKETDRQGTSSSSKFLDVCRKYNADELTHDDLIQSTARLGFVNVIDAFHIVNNKETPVRFFSALPNNKGIALTDDIHRLKDTGQFGNLPYEVESRWRLVETAWKLNLSRNLITVAHDEDTETLYTRETALRRITITSSRDALNGYQKGKCFYCFGNIALTNTGPESIDVDHFFPHALKQHEFKNIDGVWNLVLACQLCNRGPGGKFANVPELRFLERLHTRNQFFITSHHPLRETLIVQTGRNEQVRRNFLQTYYNQALAYLLHKWQPDTEYEAAF